MTSIFIARPRFAGVLAAAVLAGGMVTAAGAYQTHMNNALRALQAAHNQLMEALPDKAGCRTQALSLVDQAIRATESGIQAGGN